MRIRTLAATLLTPLLAAGVALPVMVAASAQTAGTTLTVSVDGSATQQVVYPWTLSKSVSPDHLGFWQGGSGTANYTVTATKGQAQNGTAGITGHISVTNGGAVATEGLDVKVTLTAPPDKTPIASQDITSTGPATLAASPGPGNQGSYSYTFAPSGLVVGKSYKVTAAVLITNHSGSGGPGPQETPGSWSGGLTLRLGTDKLTVQDTYGGSHTFDGSGTWAYSHEFTQAGDFTNTASATQDGGLPPLSAQATVHVDVYSLVVSKTVDKTEFTRTYTWSIAGQDPTVEVKVPAGQASGDQTYQVKVHVDSVDSAWAASGTITIHNPAPIDATITGVSDVMGDGAQVTLTDAPAFPAPLAAGKDLVIHWTATLGSGSPMINTATVTIDTKAEFSGYADVNFDKAEIHAVGDKAIIHQSAAVNDGQPVTGDVAGTINTDP